MFHESVSCFLSSRLVQISGLSSMETSFKQHGRKFLLDTEVAQVISHLLSLFIFFLPGKSNEGSSLSERKLFLVTHSIPSIHELPRDRERLIYIIFEDHSDRPRMFVRIQSYSRETVAELKKKIVKETNGMVQDSLSRHLVGSNLFVSSGELDFITRRIEYNDTLADIHCTDLEDNRTLASYALKDGNTSSA
jgi:hypothetical protein